MKRNSEITVKILRDTIDDLKIRKERCDNESEILIQAYENIIKDLEELEKNVERLENES